MIIISNKDIQEAKRYFILDGIKEVSSKSLFPAMIYCILSTMRSYKKQMDIFRLLKMYDLDNIESILSENQLYITIIRQMRFSNQIKNKLFSIASVWEESKAIDMIKKDIYLNNGFQIREILIKEFLGVWYKIASLFLSIIGYKNVAVIDRWVFRYLLDCGYISRKENEKLEYVLNKREYLYLENVLRLEAEKREIPLSIYSGAIWCKISSWNKEKMDLNLKNGFIQNNIPLMFGGLR